MAAEGKMAARPPRSLTEIAGQIPSESVYSPSLLELVATQLRDVGNLATAGHGEDSAAFSRLAHFARSFLTPLPACPGSPEDKDRSRCRQLSMSALYHLTTAFEASLDDHVLLAIIPYSDRAFVSPTDVITGLAPEILSRQFSRRSKSDFIVSVVLESAIRPHLSKWSSSRLTATGRVAAYEDSAPTGVAADLDASPPWVGECSTMIPLFQWALNESDPTLLKNHWSSFTPFLLALLDDANTGSRAHGLRAAEVFIRKCPPWILAERGIGTVLEEAMLPTLQFLPSHTPEAESVQLLEPAYTALVLLARTRFSYDCDMLAKRSLLDRLLREGIFSAYSYASEYVRIIEVLAEKAKLIIEELGIYAAKHLKDIIPMFCGVMMDPFLAQYSRCLLVVALALRSTVLTCWPRVFGHYTAEILRSTIVCWLNVCDSPTKGQTTDEGDLKGTLRNIATLLSNGCGGVNEGPLAGLCEMIEDKPELGAILH